ncbi:MAG: alpha/beta hydrolase [archaeon]|nr:alpha/beta hydrolase [archaeon]
MIQTIEKINNINIHYQIKGIENEKAIVFIHGLSDDLVFWEPLVNEFPDYKRVSYDLRGHGRSECKNDEGSIDLYQEDLYQLLNKLNIKEAVFVGLSLGGNIALKFAIEHPEMTKGLILMSTFSQMTSKLINIFENFEKAIQNKYENFYDLILPFCLPLYMLKTHKELLDNLKSEKAKTANIDGILGGIHAGPNFNVSNELSKIECPTLIFAGSDDEITPIELQEIIHKNIKNSKMIIFPNTCHNVLIGKNKAKINSLIKEFLKEVY